MVALHEARHLWHAIAQTGLSESDEEQEAFEYGWRTALKVFPDEEVRRAWEEANHP